MDPAEISRRLKAGRWLAGGVKSDGKPTPLTTTELARRDPLPQNGITVNRIEEIEQLKIPNGPRPMELEKIAQALRMPDDWFSVEKVAPLRPDTQAIEQALTRLEEQIVALGATQPEQPAHTPDTSEQADNSEEARRAPARGNEGTA